MHFFKIKALFADRVSFLAIHDSRLSDYFINLIIFSVLNILWRRNSTDRRRVTASTRVPRGFHTADKAH